MNRNVMKRQMFAGGGAAFPDLSGDGEITQRDILMGRGVQFMQEGGIASMGMDPMAGAPMAAGPEQMDPQVLEGAMMTASENFGDLDDAQNYEEVIDSIRGDALPIEQRYQELAQFVGPQDAQQTPESVLAMVQPVIQMAAVDGGIGGLASNEMSAEVSGPMAGGIMSTIAMEGGEEPPVNFSQGGDARRNTQDVRYYAYGGQVDLTNNMMAQPIMDPRGPIGFGTGFSGGFGGRKSKAELSLEPFKEYLAEEVQNQAMQDVTGQVAPFIQDVSAQASEKFNLNQGGQLGGSTQAPSNIMHMGDLRNNYEGNLMNGTGTQMPLPSLNAIPLAPSFGDQMTGGQRGGGPMGFADGGPVQYFAPENENRVVTPLEQEMDSRLALYERMGLGSQAERDASLANQRNLTQSQMLFDIAGAGLALATLPGDQSLAQALAGAAGATQLTDKLSARAQSLSDFQTAQKKEERGIRLAALTSSEAALTARTMAQDKKDLFNLENAANIAAASTAYSRSQTTALDLADVKTQSAKELVLAQTALQELKGQQGQAIEETKAKLREKIIQLQQENLLINNDIALKNDLNKIGVNHSNDLQKLEINDTYATKLQNSRLALSQETSNLDRALNYSKLNLSSRTEDRLAINQELNQARDDLKLLIDQGKLELAKDKELRIKTLENSKLLIDQASLSLSVNADERAALDQKFNQAIKEKELLLSQEKFELAKDVELRIKTIDEQRLLLNYKQLDLEGKKVLNKSLNDELDQARKDKKQQLDREKFGLAEQTELRIKTLEDKKLIINQAELDLKTEGQDFSKILSNKKLALEREKLKLNTLGSSFDAKVIEIMSDEALMEAYAEGRLGKGEVAKINNALISYTIGEKVWDPSAGDGGAYVLVPKQLDPTVLSYIARRKEKGGLGPFDTTSADTTDNLGPTQTNAFNLVLDKPAGDLTKLNLTNMSDATGVENTIINFLGNAIEIVSGGLIDSPATKTQTAKANLNTLNFSLETAIQQARQGKDTEGIRKQIKSLVPDPAKWLQGDSVAREKALAVVAFVNTELSIQTQRLKIGAANKAEKNEIEKNINTLTNLRNSYQLVYNSYNKNKANSGSGIFNAKGETIDDFITK